jgi:hypothetical protein
MVQPRSAYLCYATVGFLAVLVLLVVLVNPWALGLLLGAVVAMMGLWSLGPGAGREPG